MKIGDKIKCNGEKQRYTVQAFDNRFVIMTKPFNARKTYLYSIVDLKRGVRGRDNLIFGSFNPYNTKEGAEENLKDLQTGEMEVSHRNYKRLEPEELSQLLEDESHIIQII